MQISNKVKYGAIVGGALLIVYGIYKYIKVQKNLLENFEYKVRDFSVNTINFNNLSGTLDVEFTNKSDINITVKNLAIDFYFNGNYAGWVEEANQFDIAPKSTTPIVLQFYLNPSTFLGSASEIYYYITHSRETIISIQGYASVRSGFINATLPINYETNLRDILS